MLHPVHLSLDLKMTNHGRKANISFFETNDVSRPTFFCSTFEEKSKPNFAKVSVKTNSNDGYSLVTYYSLANIVFSPP